MCMWEQEREREREREREQMSKHLLVSAYLMLLRFFLSLDTKLYTYLPIYVWSIFCSQTGLICPGSWRANCSYSVHQQYTCGMPGIYWVAQTSLLAICGAVTPRKRLVCEIMLVPKLAVSLATRKTCVPQVGFFGELSFSQLCNISQHSNRSRSQKEVS